MICLFPGLGATGKLFDQYTFPGHKVFKAEFLIPLKNETLQDYCRRMSGEIPFDDEYIFIGVSFGGIIAQEISKIIHPKKLILISTIKTRNEKPGYFFIARHLPLYQIVPVAVLKWWIIFLGDVFTPKNKSERKFFISVVREANDRVIRWGIRKTLFWEQKETLPGITHIHGTKDRVFPINKIKADIVIEGGSHFMLIQRSSEINSVINRVLSTN